MGDLVLVALPKERSTNRPAAPTNRGGSTYYYNINIYAPTRHFWQIVVIDDATNYGVHVRFPETSRQTLRFYAASRIENFVKKSPKSRLLPSVSLHICTTVCHQSIFIRI